MYFSMKKLSLLSLLWLVAFVAMPIYAQDVEENVYVDEWNIVTEDVEPSYGVNEDGVALETVDVDNDLAEFDFNAILENEEIQNAFEGFTKEETAGILGVLAWAGTAFGMVSLSIALLLGILCIVAMWKIFTKAWEAGWKAIIPVYNTYILYKIVGMKNWFWYTLIGCFVFWLIAGLLWQDSTAGGILILLSWLISGIIAIVAAFKLPRKFGWGVFASVLYVLFTPICMLILAFGKYKYQWKKETVVEA